jgi:hypothetical protein
MVAVAISPHELALRFRALLTALVLLIVILATAWDGSLGRIGSFPVGKPAALDA